MILTYFSLIKRVKIKQSDIDKFHPIQKKRRKKINFTVIQDLQIILSTKTVFLNLKSIS